MKREIFPTCSRELMARLLAFEGYLVTETGDALFLPKPFSRENLRWVANRIVSGPQSQSWAAP